MRRNKKIRKAGRMKYVPSNLIDELQSIKEEKGIVRDSEGFSHAVRYCQVGREVEKMRDRFFLQDIFKKKKR